MAVPAPTTDPPAPAVQPASAPPAAEAFDNAFPDDGLDTAPEPSPAPPPAPTAKPDAPAKAPDAKKGADIPPKAQKPPEAPAAPPPDPSNDFTPPAVAKPSDLRSWAVRMGGRAQKAETELGQLKNRLTELEKQPHKQDDDKSSLAQELASAKKRLEEYEGNMRLTNYERSDEYQEKYQKPYSVAVARAHRQVKELLVSEPKPGGETDENGKPLEFIDRQATEADFDEIYGLPLGPATRLAKAKFGDAAQIVINHRERIRELAESAVTAINDYKAKAGEFETQTKAQQAQQEQAMLKMFTMATEGHAKRAPDLFQERQGDTEGNELLAKGKQFAGAVFGGNEGLTPQQVAFRDAMAFNRLAAYPRLIRDLKTAKAKLTEAESAIASLRDSGPGKPEPGVSTESTSTAKTWESAFDEAVK